MPPVYRSALEQAALQIIDYARSSQAAMSFLDASLPTLAALVRALSDNIPAATTVRRTNFTGRVTFQEDGGGNRWCPICRQPFIIGQRVTDLYRPLPAEVHLTEDAGEVHRVWVERPRLFHTDCLDREDGQ